MKREILLPSITTALVVGTILTVGNQWSVLQRGAFDRALLWHTSVNLVVPFLVSYYSRRSALQRRRNSGD